MRTDRLVSIIMLLLDHKRVSAQELADRFEVSLRTIYRDLEAIDLAGIPIRATPGVNGGYEIMPQYKIDNKTFSASELSALVMGLTGLSGIMQRDELTHALAKVNSLIPEEQAKEIRQFSDSYRFDWTPWIGNEFVQRSVELLRSAIRGHHPVAFRYLSTKGRVTSRVVEPCQLLLKDGRWYLYAWCRKREDYRTFRVTRMKIVSIYEETFEPREFPEAELRFEEIVESLQTEILLRVDPAVLDRVLDHCSPEDVTWETDHYLVRFPFIPNDYYYDQLLSFGSGCECLEPESVRTEICRRAEEIAAVYHRRQVDNLHEPTKYRG